MPLQIKLEPIFPERDVIAKRGATILRSLESVVSGDIARQIEGAMEKRVANWKRKPNFKSDFNSLPTRLSLLVKPAGAGLKQWKIVSGGAKAHHIVSRKGKNLFIHGGVGGYSPKTRPGNFYGGSGTYGGNSFYIKWPYFANHPGVQAREFEKHIAEEETPKIVNKIQAVIDRVARA